MSDTKGLVAILETMADEGAMIHCLDWAVIQRTMREAATALRASPSEAEGVSVPKDIYEGALCYIKHVGSNWTMRGEPHPQQWLVDGLERCGRSPREGEKP
jgi:hypothetical protein